MTPPSFTVARFKLRPGPYGEEGGWLLIPLFSGAPLPVVEDLPGGWRAIHVAGLRWEVSATATEIFQAIANCLRPPDDPAPPEDLAPPEAPQRVGRIAIPRFPFPGR